jgi:hypothetical protein
VLTLLRRGTQYGRARRECLAGPVWSKSDLHRLLVAGLLAHCHFTDTYPLCRSDQFDNPCQSRFTRVLFR